jgi:hypothetical protein
LEKSPLPGDFSFGARGKVRASAEFAKFSEFSAAKKIGDALIRRFGFELVRFRVWGRLTERGFVAETNRRGHLRFSS